MVLLKTSWISLFSIHYVCWFFVLKFIPLFSKEVDFRIKREHYRSSLTGFLSELNPELNQKLDPALGYYSSINFSSSNQDLKLQLHNLINPHIVFDYSELWIAFAEIDKNLPRYPCDNNESHIPDIYR
jgi:hypothetical protein